MPIINAAKPTHIRYRPRVTHSASIREIPSASQNQCVDNVSSQSAIFLPYIVKFPTANNTEAAELIAANRGGALRFKGRMIESMHVENAKLTIERSRHAMGGAIS